jgi:flagellar hook-associated protein 3 FlgL
MTSAFRVTQRSLTNTSLAGLQANLDRMQRLQEQLSSGKALNRPSDSPTSTVSALRYRAELKRNAQYDRNASDGLAWLGTADNALTDGMSLVRRVRELVLTAANAATDQQGREAIAAEIDTLRDGLLATANTSFLGRPVFAGTASTTTAYDAAGNFLGDSGQVKRTVASGVDVQVNVSGPDAFSFTPVVAGGPSDLFATLSTISTHLRSGNPVDVQTMSTDDLNALDAGFGQMQKALTTVGARYAQVQTMQTRVQSLAVDLTSSLSDVENVDLPKTIMDLQMQQVAYQSALSATAKVIQPSLVDFLR